MWEQAENDVRKYNDKRAELQGEYANFSIEEDLNELNDLAKELFSAWNTSNGNEQSRTMEQELSNLDLVEGDFKSQIQKTIQELDFLQATLTLIQKASRGEK